MRLSIRPLAQKLHFRPVYEYCRTFYCRKTHAGTGSGRNDNEAVAGAASEAFARWLHHRCALVELPSAEAYRFTVRYPINYL